MKKILAGLTLAAGLLATMGQSTNVTTVYFPLGDWTGATYTNPISIWPVSAQNPVTAYGRIFAGAARTFYPSNNIVTNTFVPNDYVVYLPSIGKQFTIHVFLTNAPMNAVDLAVDIPTYTYTTLMPQPTNYYTLAQVNLAISNAVATLISGDAVLALLNSGLGDTNAALQSAISNLSVTMLAALDGTNSALLAEIVGRLTDTNAAWWSRFSALSNQVAELASNSLSLTATGLVQIASGRALVPGTNTVFRSVGNNVAVDYYRWPTNPIVSAEFIDSNDPYINFTLVGYPYGSTNWQIWAQVNEVGAYNLVGSLPSTNGVMGVVTKAAGEGETWSDATNANWYGVTYPGPNFTATNTIGYIHQ